MTDQQVEHLMKEIERLKKENKKMSETLSEIGEWTQVALKMVGILEKEAKMNNKLDELTEYKLLYQEKQNEVYKLLSELEKERERVKELEKDNYRMYNDLLEKTDGYYARYVDQAKKAESRLSNLQKAVRKLRNRRFQIIGQLYDQLEELYKALEESEGKVEE